jgi:hypothetical protein
MRAYIMAQCTRCGAIITVPFALEQCQGDKSVCPTIQSGKAMMPKGEEVAFVKPHIPRVRRQEGINPKAYLGPKVSRTH